MFISSSHAQLLIVEYRITQEMGTLHSALLCSMLLPSIHVTMATISFLVNLSEHVKPMDYGRAMIESANVSPQNKVIFTCMFVWFAFLSPLLLSWSYPVFNTHSPPAPTPTHLTLSLFSHHFPLAVDCGNLSSPQNGEVDVQQTTLGSVATYTCNSGYDLVGVGGATCLPSGVWSDETPECIGKASTSNLIWCQTHL